MTLINLTVKEKLFIKERLQIELEYGLEVYEQEDIDLMTNIVNKLDGE